ncbi:MAG: hypothetical protein CL398_08310 [Acidiferrobacteraceae bacterium]|nr:hypothetical protein [Acidiferrobacteraceae bacterium]|tara:strand:+ start:276 stop:1427 length:1152 start_codon:yes stop_codon:yes gene_type:complete
MKHRLTFLLKIAIVAIIFLVVFNAINWQDSYSVISKDGNVISTVEGEIIGSWSGESVDFIRNNSANPITVGQQIESDGSQKIIQPGFLTYFTNLDPINFILGAICFLAFAIIANCRWWWLLRANNLNVGFLEAQRFAWIGFFFNNIVPGTTGGDIVKGVYIAQHCRTEKIQAVVTVIVDRIIGLLSLLLVGCIASIAVFDRFPVFVYAVWGLAVATIIICSLLLAKTLRSSLNIEKLIAWLPTRLRALASEIDLALLQYRSHLRGIIVWILISPLTYGIYVASFFLMDLSLEIGLSLVDYYFIVPIASIVQAVPLFPGGWGVGEAVYGTLVGKFGAITFADVPTAEQIMRTRGVVLSVLHRTHVAAWSLMGGIFLLMYRYKKI